MVRAVVLETSPSGTYYNMSEGIADTAMSTIAAPQVTAQFTTSNSGVTLTCTNTSTNAISYNWSFGDGASSTIASPAHTYSTTGIFTVTLVAANQCFSDTFTYVVTISVTSLNELQQEGSFSVFPNPASTNISIQYPGVIKHIIIYDCSGKQVYSCEAIKEQNKIDVSIFERGLYLVKLVDDNNKVMTKKLVIQ
jgi:PKD repeat protein